MQHINEKAKLVFNRRRKVTQRLLLFKQLWKINIKQFAHIIVCQSHTSTNTMRMNKHTHTQTHTKHSDMQLTHTYAKANDSLIERARDAKIYHILFTKKTNALQYEWNCYLASYFRYIIWIKRNLLQTASAVRLNYVLWLHDIEWTAGKSI